MGFFGKLFGSTPSEPSPEVRALIVQLDDPDAAVRASAAESLGNLGGAAKAAGEKLLELLNDEDGDVCNKAADAYSKVERGF
ncbi:MAG: HEAT repeat domain-containing protein [bacterium]|jgi:HEAT repeat protein|nr:HEAT repeat domain-containing protein [Planctomycetota bacterium]HIL52208.1 HEAT repeat domain-containing protein [Planctomycetota bacterium]